MSQIPNSHLFFLPSFLPPISLPFLHPFFLPYLYIYLSLWTISYKLICSTQGTLLGALILEFWKLWEVDSDRERLPGVCLKGYPWFLFLCPFVLILVHQEMNNDSSMCSHHQDVLLKQMWYSNFSNPWVQWHLSSLKLFLSGIRSQQL